jgi:hypothetical protein
MSCFQRLLTVVMLLILGFPRPTLAQEVTATLGVTRTIKSTILNEDRKVFVHLPASYTTHQAIPTQCCTCWMALRRFCSK